MLQAFLTGNQLFRCKGIVKTHNQQEWAPRYGSFKPVIVAQVQGSTISLQCRLARQRRTCILAMDASNRSGPRFDTLTDKALPYASRGFDDAYQAYLDHPHDLPFIEAVTLARLSAAIQYLPPLDQDFVINAYQYAKQCHGTQTRRSGEPYYTHPVEAGIIIASMEMDADTVAATLLHDVVEDTDTTLDEIAEAFNPQVSSLVEGVTKYSAMVTKMYGAVPDSIDRDDEQLLNGLLTDHRIICIKLADRLHNFRTMGAMPEVKARKKSQETQELLLVLGQCIGLYQIVDELADWCMRYDDPVQYDKWNRMLEGELASVRPVLEAARDLVLRTVPYEPTIGGRLREGGVKVNIRRMSTYEAGQKLKGKGPGASVMDVEGRVFLEVILDPVQGKSVTFDDKHARKLCHTVLTEISNQLKSPRQNSMLIHDLLDNHQPSGQHCLLTTILIDTQKVGVSPGVSAGGSECCVGEPDALTIGLKVTTKHKHKLERLGIFNYIRANTRSLETVRGFSDDCRGGRALGSYRNTGTSPVPLMTTPTNSGTPSSSGTTTTDAASPSDTSPFVNGNAADSSQTTNGNRAPTPDASAHPRVPPPGPPPRDAYRDPMPNTNGRTRPAQADVLQFLFPNQKVLQPQTQLNGATPADEYYIKAQRGILYSVREKLQSHAGASSFKSSGRQMLVFDHRMDLVALPVGSSVLDYVIQQGRHECGRVVRVQVNGREVGMEHVLMESDRVYAEKDTCRSQEEMLMQMCLWYEADICNTTIARQQLERVYQHCMVLAPKKEYEEARKKLQTSVGNTGGASSVQYVQRVGSKKERGFRMSMYTQGHVSTQADVNMYAPDTMDRAVEVLWDDVDVMVADVVPKHPDYCHVLVVAAQNDKGVLGDVATILASHQQNIRRIEANTDDGCDVYRMKFVLDGDSAAHSKMVHKVATMTCVRALVLATRI